MVSAFSNDYTLRTRRERGVLIEKMRENRLKPKQQHVPHDSWATPHINQQCVKVLPARRVANPTFTQAPVDTMQIKIFLNRCVQVTSSNNTLKACTSNHRSIKLDNKSLHTS